MPGLKFLCFSVLRFGNHDRLPHPEDCQQYFTCLRIGKKMNPRNRLRIREAFVPQLLSPIVNLQILASNDTAASDLKSKITGRSRSLSEFLLGLLAYQRGIVWIFQAYNYNNDYICLNNRSWVTHLYFFCKIRILQWKPWSTSLTLNLTSVSVRILAKFAEFDELTLKILKNLHKRNLHGIWAMKPFYFD